MIARDGQSVGARGVFALAREDGIALVTCLVLLAAVMLVGIAAGSMATEGERAARVDRDRQLAFMAAEAALKDAQDDIERAPGSKPGRGEVFAAGPAVFPANCADASSELTQGLCLAAAGPVAGPPAWLVLDLAQPSTGVAYGRFTGRLLATGAPGLAARAPRYLVEALPYRRAGEAADESAAPVFRITAIGFGVQAASRVVLQTYYRRSEQ